MKTIDVYGIGNPLIDLLAHVSDQFLQDNELDKNRMYLVDRKRQKALLDQLLSQNTEVLHTSGGSCANTMIGISQLGGKAVFSGKVGNDDYGKIYRDKMREAGVQPYLGTAQGMTGSSLVLVTQEGARTMNTCLGMSQELHPSDINEEALRSARYLYITGYLWDTDTQKETVMAAIEKARKHGTSVSMSLSDPFCVNRHQEDFKRLLTESVDLVFCNQEEAFALTGTAVTQEALERIAREVASVVLTLGSRGAVIVHENKMVYIDPLPVPVVDTTGAGDAFAAGFLFGITQGKSTLASGRIASYLATQVIAQMGPRCSGKVELPF